MCSSFHSAEDKVHWVAACPGTIMIIDDSEGETPDKCVVYGSISVDAEVVSL